MAITALNTIKNWFKTGLIPTQAQFWDTWDSFRHKSENISVAEIEGIDELLLNKAEKEALESHINDENAHAPLFLEKEDKSKKGTAGGYAPLDDFAKLASQYLNIIDNLYDGGSKSILSAQQGLVLKNEIDAINTLLSSDNINLDTVQEIVDAIESIQNSAGTVLVNDLTTGGTTKALTAEMGKVLQNTKLTATIATDAETQITALATEDNNVISRLKLLNWWSWQKTIAQQFSSSVQALSFNTGSYISIGQYSADFVASPTKRISIDAINSRITGQNGATTSIIYFNPTPSSQNLYIPNASGTFLLDSTLKSVDLFTFSKSGFSPLYIRVNNASSDVAEDLRINVNSGVTRPFFQRCISGAATKGAGLWERTVSTVKLNNSGANQPGLAINSVTDVNLTSPGFVWTVDALASRTGALVTDLILSQNKLIDVEDKTVNTFRITMEFSYTAGGGDGTIAMSIVNPTGVVIDQESESINIDGNGATSKISVFRFSAVKTADNDIGYTLRMSVGSKAITDWRVKSILRTNN